MVGKDFELGDLVWARMKSYPPWPAKIAEPPAKPSGGKKGHHYVLFFGSNNFAWILDDKIVPHSEEMIENSSKKKLQSGLSEAILEIQEESQKSPPKKQPPKEVIKTAISDDAFDKMKKSKVAKLKKKSPLKKKKRSIVEVNGGNYTTLYEDYSSFSGERSQTKKQKFSVVDISADARTIAPEDPKDLPANLLKRRPYIERPDTPPLDIMDKRHTLLVKKIKPTTKRIGFLGLTALGRGIVKNLLNSGHSITVCNMEPVKCEPFEKAGVKTVTTPMDVVEECDITFCCVSDAEAAKKIVYGRYGILSGLDHCGVANLKSYVELTSMDAKTSKTIAEEICIKGAKYMEAPISGSRSQAEDGQLLVIAAGDQELFNACTSCFRAFAKNAYFIGLEVGLASKMNLIFSMFNGSMIAALAEALTLVKRCNLSCENFLDILKSKSIYSPMIQEKGTAMINENYTSENILLHQHRDLSLALVLANSLHQPLFLSSAANDLFKRAKQQYYGEHDVSAVIEGVRVDSKNN